MPERYDIAFVMGGAVGLAGDFASEGIFNY